MKLHLRQLLEQALADCVSRGILQSESCPDFAIDIPAHAEHGDFAANLAMLLARAEKQPPRKVAEALVTAFGDGAGLCSRVEIAGPGFINFFLAPRCWYGVLDDIHRLGEGYGQ